MHHAESTRFVLSTQLLILLNSITFLFIRNVARRRTGATRFVFCLPARACIIAWASILCKVVCSLCVAPMGLILCHSQEPLIVKFSVPNLHRGRVDEVSQVASSSSMTSVESRTFHLLMGSLSLNANDCRISRLARRRKGAFSVFEIHL